MGGDVIYEKTLRPNHESIEMNQSNLYVHFQIIVFKFLMFIIYFKSSSIVTNNNQKLTQHCTHSTDSIDSFKVVCMVLPTTKSLARGAGASW